MTIVDYARVLKRGWGFVVGGLLICIGAALVANVVLPREYTSHLTIYVSGQAAGDSAVAAQQVAQSQVLSFRQLMTEDRVLDDVITHLRLNETPAELAGRIVVSNDPDTLLLDVGVTDPSPDQAARIANSLADSFAEVVAQLESCSGSAADVPCLKPIGVSFPVVTAQVLKRADPPDDPSSPQPRLNLAVGALVGLILGGAAAFVRNMRGRRIRSAQHLQEVLEAPNLGIFAADSRVRNGPALVPAGAAERSDDFRRLASRLRLIDVANPRKVIVFTSARPRAGTTTMACNLAIALAAEGREVALVDADMRGGGIADVLGVDSTVGLSTVLIGEVPLEQAMQPYGDNGHLAVLATGELSPSPRELLGSEQMSTLVTELRERYEFVIFDTPPVLTAADAAVLAAQVDGAMLVCRSGQLSSTEVVAAAQALRAEAAKLLGTLLTVTAPRRESSSVQSSDPEPLLGPAPAALPSQEATADPAPVDGPSEASSIALPDESSPISPPVGVRVAAPAPGTPVNGVASEAPPRPSPKPRPTPIPRQNGKSAAGDADVVNSRRLG